MRAAFLPPISGGGETPSEFFHPAPGRLCGELGQANSLMSAAFDPRNSPAGLAEKAHLAVNSRELPLWTLHGNPLPAASARSAVWVSFYDFSATALGRQRSCPETTAWGPRPASFLVQNLKPQLTTRVFFYPPLQQGARPFDGEGKCRVSGVLPGWNRGIPTNLVLFQPRGRPKPAGQTAPTGPNVFCLPQRNGGSALNLVSGGRDSSIEKWSPPRFAGFCS